MYGNDPAKKLIFYPKFPNQRVGRLHAHSQPVEFGAWGAVMIYLTTFFLKFQEHEESRSNNLLLCISDIVYCIFVFILLTECSCPLSCQTCHCHLSQSESCKMHGYIINGLTATVMTTTRQQADICTNLDKKHFLIFFK